MNDLEQLKKALSLAQVGSALQQPLIDRVLQEIIEINNPLRVNLPRKPGSGLAWILNQRTSRGAAAAFTDDVTEPADTQGAYLQKEFPYKTVVDRRKVTRKLQAVGRTLLDIEASEVQDGLQNVADSEENALFNGDSSANPLQFDGLHKLITPTQTIIAGDGINGGPMTLDLMDHMIDLNRGMPNMIVMSKRANRKLNSLLQVQQRFADTVQVKGGFRVMAYNGIPVYRSIWIPETQVVGTSGPNTTDIYCLDTSSVWVGELTPLNMIRLAQTSSQFAAFDIFEDLSLVVANDIKVSKLSGVILDVN
ncbi:MAG: phage major capsid protein [Elusimicrobiota bacterium]